MGDWFDSIPGRFSSNVGRMLQGVEFTVGDYESGMPERTVKVASITETVVGFDSAGIFAAVVVKDTTGIHWTLYNDGTIADCEDVTVGHHHLVTVAGVEDDHVVTRVAA